MSIVATAMRQPEVFELIMRMLTIQVKWPARFSPVPPAFIAETKTETDAKGPAIDMPRYTAAVERIEKWMSANPAPSTDSEIQTAVGDDGYAIMRFGVESLPLNLSYMSMCIGTMNINMYKVNHTAGEEARFVRVGHTPTYLYHGSGLANWHSITHNGIRVMSGTALMTSGAVWGDGIYLSDSVGMSYNFCRDDGTGFIIGVYEVYDAAAYQKAEHIYVVPDEQLLKLRYMLYVNSGADRKIMAELNNGLRETLDRHAAARAGATAREQKITSTRVARDLAGLGSKYAYTVRDGVYTITRTGTTAIFRVRFDGYPLTPPQVATTPPSAIPGWREKWTARSTIRDVLDLL